MARKNEKMARKARIACEKWRETFKRNIDLYHLMHTFVLGEQWSQDEEDDMIKTYRKVPMTSPKLGAMANSLLGEQQQNTPQLQVVPMSNCDEETAHLREIILKDIVFSTHATTCYQVAAMQAAVGGFGALGIGTVYTHERSFEQDIEFYHFKDATRCYWDIGAETINKTDGTYCGYNTRISWDKFRQLYGKDLEEKVRKTSNITQTKEEIALAVEPDEGNNPFMWADGDGITLNHHFERRYEKDTLYKLSNGRILNEEEMTELVRMSREMNERINEQQMQQDMMMLSQMEGGEMMPQSQMGQELSQMGLMGVMPEDGVGVIGDHDILPPENGMQVPTFRQQKPTEDIEDVEDDMYFMTLWDEGEVVRIEDSRPSKRHKVMHYLFAGDYELDKTEFPSQQLPIIFVDNNSYYDKTGKQICRSFFGDCRDTQRYINYLRTQSCYILKVSRYDQWIGPKTVVQSMDTRRNWADPTNTQGLLAYDKDPDGQKPEQVRPPELSQSLFQQYELAIQDLYTSTGLYPARMGNNGDEASGRAIDARTRQGSYTTYVFFNSINRAIATAGEVTNEMIPNVYDTERVMTLMLPDKGMQNVTINQQMDEYGEKIKNDIRKGTYQVRLKPGPSYEGQKELALQSLREVLQADPTSFNLIADLYAENLPLSNTLEIKNRLKTRVPPQIIEAGKTGQMPQQQGPTPEQQAVQIQQQAAQADMQFKQQQIMLKQQELALKEKEVQAEIEIERMKLEIAQLELSGNVEEQRIRYLAESDRTASDNAIAHADNLVKILTHKQS